MSGKPWLAVVIAAFLMTAGRATADEHSDEASSPIPTLLEPYTEAGRPAMGDYRWMRGGFPDASDQDVQVFKAAESYGAECYERHRAQNTSELRSMGIEAVEQDTFSIDYECSAFNRPNVTDGTTWEQFNEAIETVRPLMSGLIYSSDYALQAASDDDLTLSGKLRTRFLADQMIRGAFIASFRGTELFADLNALQLSIARDLLSRQMAKIDSSNSDFLRLLIAQEGWPKASVVGKEAARDAWLLVQHSDAEPALQLTALRQMELLLEEQDVSPKNFAYLYDRVMLKIAGKQRYATQFECREGRRAPQALEGDVASADRYRAAAGMETVAQNLARMEESYGACPGG